MSDVAIAGVLLAFFVVLALTAPIWGFDSRDGVDSDQPARRVAWLNDAQVGSASTVRWSGRVGSASTTRTANLLRAAARRLDPDVAHGSGPHGRPTAA